MQAGAILQLQLRRLAALERQRIIDELDDLERQIADYNDILASPERQRRIVSEELAEIVDKFGDERRTQILPFDGDMDAEDLIPEEEVVVTITRGGYAKRTRSDAYRAQRRGGKGVRGRAAAQRRRRRALLRHDHAPLAAVLHQPRPGLPGQGVRAARGRPRRQGPARGQPDGVPAGRGDRPGPRHPGLPGRAVPRARHPAGPDQEDPPGGVRLEPGRRGHRHQPASTATSSSPPGWLGGRTPTSCSSRRKGMSLRFTADDAALRPMGRATSGVTGHAFPGRRRAAVDGRRPRRGRRVRLRRHRAGLRQADVRRGVPQPGPRRPRHQGGQADRRARRPRRRHDRRQRRRGPRRHGARQGRAVAPSSASRRRAATPWAWSSPSPTRATGSSPWPATASGASGPRTDELPAAPDGPALDAAAGAGTDPDAEPGDVAGGSAEDGPADDDGVITFSWTATMRSDRGTQGAAGSAAPAGAERGEDRHGVPSGR